MADDYNGSPIPENQNPDPGSSDQNENIPDWMKDAGWETSSGTFDESKPIFDDLDDDEDEIVPADIPAWLEDAAPEGFSSDPNAIPAFEGLDVDEPFITTGDLVPPPSMESPTIESDTDQIQEEEEEPIKEAKFDIPTWLENLELDEDSQETAVAWLENMPENLRATEEELQASRGFPTEEPEIIEEPVDELAWIDEIALEREEQPPPDDSSQAELSEDLVASDLVPETNEPEKLFRQDEIESMESELPSWLKELGDDQPDEQDFVEETAAPVSEEKKPLPESQDESIPDWLRTSDEVELSDTLEAPPKESAEPISATKDDTYDLPDWLRDFEDSSLDPEDKTDDIEWLDTIPGEISETRADQMPSMEEVAEEPPDQDSERPAQVPDIPSLDEQVLGIDPAPEFEGVSPNDETLNAQVPEWLSVIGEASEQEEGEQPLPDYFEAFEDPDQPTTEDEFESQDSWLDQISEKPPEGTRDEIAAQENEIVDWLDDMEELQGETNLEDLEDLADLRDSISDPGQEVSAPVELETAKYLPPEEIMEDDTSEDFPDWLSELKEDTDQAVSLEEAIRKSDHDLNDAEIDYLNKIEEKQEEDADWLSKLDQGEGIPESDLFAPPIELEDVPEESADDLREDPIVVGGMLDRLKEASEIAPEDDVPQWLADLKEEEDPQETAVLWLQQFVNQGGNVDIKDEIKRYTDELDPGDSVPRWMEDLKNEEDPQTTAMLWLEKLSAVRQANDSPDPSPPKEEDSGWLADLEREASQSSESLDPEEVKDFDTPDEGWLADLEIDEKLKSKEDEVPDWSKTKAEAPEVEPSWMKATSPLEGDFYTDELAGGEEKEVEIPEWLAGFGEGERPENDQEEPVEDEYTWLSATDTPAGSRTPLDLNKAAISQLEGILGISHQVAKGIVSYREKNGPYKDISDLKNVPEITDSQTIEILKPEVFISDVKLDGEEPAPTPPPTPITAPQAPSQKTTRKPAKSENYEEMLVTARARVSDRLIGDATELYTSLVKKKKFLDEVIGDLQKAALDHPLEISIQRTLGDAYMQKDMLDQALEAYSKAEDLLS